jgi:hypothetical protein
LARGLASATTDSCALKLSSILTNRSYIHSSSANFVLDPAISPFIPA